MILLLAVLLILSVLVNVWLIWHVWLPLRVLSHQVKSLPEGDFGNINGHTAPEIREITELRLVIRGMVGHVRRALQQGLAYADALSDGQEIERSRLAHDLHDDAIQMLIAAGQSIDMASAWLVTNPERARAMLKVAREQTTRCVNNLRDLIANLRPPALDELGLPTALRMLPSDLPVEVTVMGSERRLADKYELTLFRAAQEALRNTQRHSKANHVSIQLNYEPESVNLTIIDNGTGFAVPPRLEELTVGGHFGLVGIKERIHKLDGNMQVKSTLGAGTTIELTLQTGESIQPANAVIDPVCGAIIEPQSAYGRADHRGTTYYFCCPVCKGSFLRDPAAYTGVSGPM